MLLCKLHLIMDVGVEKHSQLSTLTKPNPNLVFSFEFRYNLLSFCNKSFGMLNSRELHLCYHYKHEDNGVFYLIKNVFYKDSQM